MLTATFIAILFIPLFFVLISRLSGHKDDEVLTNKEEE
jgi:multidrug efflux pump